MIKKKANEVISEALSHPVRQHLVKDLMKEEGSGLQYLAIMVTRQEAKRQDTSITSIGFDRMQEEIENTHIPLLEEAGILHYNEETEWLEMDGTPDEIIESELRDD